MLLQPHKPILLPGLGQVAMLESLDVFGMITKYGSEMEVRNNLESAFAGPGPASSLDGTNVVFGKVLQGMDTVARVTCG